MAEVQTHTVTTTKIKVEKEVDPQNSNSGKVVVEASIGAKGLNSVKIEFKDSGAFSGKRKSDTFSLPRKNTLKWMMTLVTALKEAMTEIENQIM
jgi:hypothetical protein